MPVRLIILGDLRLRPEGIVSAVASATRKVEIVARCTDSEEALRAIEQYSPAVVLADVGTAAGLSGARRIGRESPETRVVALGGGAEGKAEAPGDERLDAIDTADASLEELIAALTGGARGDPSRLTTRELEVVALLELGLSNKQIARRLSIRLATVKNHVHSILAKLGVRNRREAVEAMRGETLSTTAVDEEGWSWRDAVGASPADRSGWRSRERDRVGEGGRRGGNGG